MNIVISVCLALMLALVLSIFISVLLCGRGNRLRKLKSFRKGGHYVVIYIIAIPLYVVGFLGGGSAFPDALFSAIPAAIELVVLKFGYGSVASYMSQNPYYAAVMYICFGIVALNAITFSFTVFGQTIVNFFRGITKFWARKRTACVIVGYNKDNLEILRSAVKSKAACIVFADIDSEQKDEIFSAGGCYRRFTVSDDLGAFLKRKFGRCRNRRVNIIINSGRDDINLMYSRQFSAVVAEFSTDWLEKGGEFGYAAYVFGEPENASAFSRFSKETGGRISYINKYRLIAMDFIGRYPITNFMTEKHLDYNNATLREGVDIRFTLIGFGSTNEQLLLGSIANDQLLVRDAKGRLRPYAVCYDIYDKKPAKSSKTLNHTLFRYKNECLSVANPEEYLPLPQEPAKTAFHKMDINDTKFYASLRTGLEQKKGRTAYNYVSVAFGSDMENIDLADKLADKFLEWDILPYTYIFVKVRDSKLAEEISTGCYRSGSGRCIILPFGNETELIYNIRAIVNEPHETLAKLRHYSYVAEKYENAADAERAAREKWYCEWNQVQRESNIYGCLSLKMKLQLLGYDLIKAAGEPGCVTEFFAAYQKNDPIIYREDAAGRKKPFLSLEDMERDSVRHTLAVQEHQRWNAYMISCGVLPAPLTLIAEKDDGKRLDIRLHGNITTMDGLKKFRELMAEKHGIPLLAADVIKYDYQLLDDSPWLIEKGGYKVVALNETLNT